VRLASFMGVGTASNDSDVSYDYYYTLILEIFLTFRSFISEWRSIFVETAPA